jgi:hypothetical protein
VRIFLASLAICGATLGAATLVAVVWLLTVSTSRLP